MLAACLTWAPAASRGEAGGPPVPAALAIPALASRAEAFVPDGFSRIGEVSGDLGSAYPGVAQIYENADGRRALLIGVRRPDGFEATGWGFVLPCRSCGADLPGSDNLQVLIRNGTVVELDRSASAAGQTRTQAELTLRMDRALGAWRLASVLQSTFFTGTGRAEQSFVDYLTGDTRDAVGRYEGQTFFAETVEKGSVAPRVLPLDSLNLY